MFVLADSYPADAIGGACFLSGSGQRTVLDIGPDGREFRRKERIIVAEHDYEAQELIDGRPCLGEQTIRSLANAVGLYDATVVTRLTDELYAANRANSDLLVENERLRTALANLDGISPYPPGAITLTAADFVVPAQPLEEVAP